MAREFGWSVKYISGLSCEQITLLCEGLSAINGGKRPASQSEIDKLMALAEERGLKQ